MTWASASSTPSPLPPGWPWRACGPWWPSIPPSCSGPTTRCSTMSACKTCRWFWPWTGAAWSGEDGETHQGLFDLSFLRQLPNLTLMAPKDENELRDMLYTAVEHPGPVALRYPRGKGVGVAFSSTLHKIAHRQGRGAAGRAKTCSSWPWEPRSIRPWPRPSSWRRRASAPPWSTPALSSPWMKTSS